jgi:hypothetical protein
MQDQVRYILFAIDGRFHQHEGIIVPTLSQAREEAFDFLNEKIGTKMIIASFLDDPKREYTNLHKVEVIDNKTSLKKLAQLDLFKNYQKEN